MPELTSHYPKPILKITPSPIKDIQEETIQQDNSTQKAKHSNRSVYTHNQSNKRINTPRHVYFNDKIDYNYRSIDEHMVNTPEETKNFSKLLSFFSKLWNPNNINLSDPNDLNKTTTTILKSYKNHQYIHLLLLSAVFPPFLLILVPRATVDIAKKIKLTPVEDQKHIEDPIVNKFISDLTESVNNNDTADITEATDPNLLDESQNKHEALLELQDELHRFLKQIQKTKLFFVNIKKLLNDLHAPDTPKSFYAFLGHLYNNIESMSLDDLESTKKALRVCLESF